MLYYDIFDSREEEEFQEAEEERCRAVLNQLTLRLRSNDILLTEISLDVPIKLCQWESFAPSLCSSEHNSLKQLSISHWGLGDGGIPSLTRALCQDDSSIQQLALPCCGMTSISVETLLSGLAKGNRSLDRLDISRNSLWCEQAPKHLQTTFHEFLPMVRIQELNLSATNLDARAVRSLLWGIRNNPYLLSLDISNNNNFDASLESLLECIIEYLPRLRYLQQFVLTKGASSSTCIVDYKNGVQVLERLTQSLAENTSLFVLGPLSILPLDRHQTCPNTQELYYHCRDKYLNHHIPYLLDRNRCQAFLRNDPSSLWNASLLSLALARTNSMKKSHPPSILFYLLRECSTVVS